MEPEDSLLHSQESSTGPYSEPDQSRPYCSFLSLQDPSYPPTSYWWGHYATNRKVADSNPDEAIDFFNFLNPSNRTMALEFTQPLTEVSTRKCFWG
jgi:hypothetical protein